MNRGHDTDEKIEAHAVAGLQISWQRLGSDACDARLAVGLVGECVHHVVGELAVDADRLQALEDGFACCPRWRLIHLCL
jgi:hypothetical protein